MRGIKINPTERTITEVDVKSPNKSLKSLYELIGCSMVELIQLDEDVIMVCDEEAKLKTITGAFRFYGSPELVIAGNAIILGGNGNRFKVLHENVENIRKIVEWVKPEDVPEPHIGFAVIKGKPTPENIAKARVEAQRDLERQEQQ